MRVQRQRLEQILLLALRAEIDDKVRCIGYPQTISIIKKTVQGHAMLVYFRLNLELMSVYLNLSFVWY